MGLAAGHVLAADGAAVAVVGRDETRTQEVQLASSNDGGITFRELVRQEFNFSPGGATWEHEDWTVRQKDVTHIRLMIKPDKRRTDLFATLTSFGFF